MQITALHPSLKQPSTGYFERVSLDPIDSLPKIFEFLKGTAVLVRSPMLDTFFDLPTYSQLLLLSVMSASMVGVSFVWLGWLNRRFLNRPTLLPAGPAFVPVTTVFALFLSFLAVDIWTQERMANDYAFKEVSALTRLYELKEPAALNSPAAAPVLEAYRQAVSKDEWGVHFNRQATPGATSALRDLRLQGAHLSREGAPAPLMTQWFKAVDELQEARLKRLMIASDNTDNNQWWVVIALALFAYLAIATSHMDRPPAGRMVLVLFAIANTLALWQLAMHTNPYNGGFTRVTMPTFFTEQPAES